MKNIQIISPKWRANFLDLLNTASSSLLIVSPYITMHPVEETIKVLGSHDLAETIRIRVVTDLSAQHLAAGVTDPAALLQLKETITNTTIIHLRGVHAKVYVANEVLAIITSSNLTDGGIYRNIEYGVLINESAMIHQIINEWDKIAKYGRVIHTKDLQEMNERAKTLKLLYSEMISNFSLEEKRKEFGKLTEAVNQELSVQNWILRSDNAIFSETILNLLRQFGPMATVDMYPYIRQWHPELCDDRIPYIWKGRIMGTLWQHRVRTAQQNMLKKKPSPIRYNKATQQWFLT